MSMPEVSIIMASYNKGTMIGETINSVLTQSNPKWELIIIDDSSTDGSIQQIKQNFSDERIVLVENSMNKGANACRNQGLKLAKGKYIIFLDADDLLISTCIENRLRCAESVPENNLLIFSMGVFYKNIGDDKRQWTPKIKTPLQDFLAHRLPWSILQPLWRTDFLKELGGFDESFERLQDVELNTRALIDAKLKLKIVGGKPDCYYRIDEARKNFESVVFLTKWVNSAIKYCDKFSKLISIELKKYLMGTIYQTYLQIIYNFKKKNISKSEMKQLEETIMASSIIKEATLIKRTLFSFSGFMNVNFFRIPGLNSIIQKMILS